MKPFPGIRRVPQTSARSYGTTPSARPGPVFLSKKYIREREAKAAGRAPPIPPISKKEAKAEVIRDAPKRRAEERQAHFTKRIQEVLGHDEIAKEVRIDKENKKVRTAAGDLPISPVMDPVWMDVRTRYRTPKPRPKSKSDKVRDYSLSSSGAIPRKHKYKIRMGKDKKTQSPRLIVMNKLPNGGRFRVKLEQNPYVHALATPVRFCPVTGTSLPKYFLQNFKAVTNPDTQGHWFIPGDVEVSWTHKDAMEEKLRQLDDLENRSEKLDDVGNGAIKPGKNDSKELDEVNDEPRKAFEGEDGSKKADNAEDKSNKCFEETTGSTKPEEEKVESKMQTKKETQTLDTAVNDFEQHFKNVIGSDKNDKKEKSSSKVVSNHTAPRKQLPEDPLVKQKETDQLLLKSPSAYVVSRKPVIDSMAGKRGKTPFGDGWRTLLGRNPKVMNSDIPKRLVWREDMGDFVLENLRKNIMKYITEHVEADEGHSSCIQPLETWEDVHDAQKRSCLLWYDANRIPAGESRWDEWMKEGKVKPFATYDVPDAKYEKSLPVYDIGRLMGPKYLAKLREMPVFREHSLFVVKKKRSIPLQLYLWKLQAYVAEYPTAEKVAEVSAEQRRLDRKRREEKRQEELVQEQFRLEEEAREGYIRAQAERARITQERIEREMRGFDEPRDKTPEAGAEREVGFGSSSTSMPRGTVAPMTSADFAAQLMATPRAASSPSAWGSAAIKPISTIKVDRKAEAPKRPTIKAKVEAAPKRSAKDAAAPMTAADFTAQLMATPKVGSGSGSWGNPAVKSVSPAKVVNKPGLTSPSAKVEGGSKPQRAATTAEIHPRPMPKAHRNPRQESRSQR
ncbi:hypothetical protein HER10_EVM0010636 [Colletotrichum scovillei]|uniref:Esterase-like protein n=1 Tax=Colletotrichum scovillei TaxID=1209932 RepID=A0A9P7ULK4_9PEZI|nr:uncharacterized protein HER10_EVM0010636 [Colletotrichum scovillei]KAF4785850.1 hypothetical protein HER10_EVM0010636 [Colletotrichum scovillei]KAG7055720.1 esterase-like protein [Colletotrichum scovillei]KAG7075164.1 esterase-like protein [Colletotrichum scovillei]KAG7082256.1 esterase-like protein [Colletotrichum scovillei]